MKRCLSPLLFEMCQPPVRNAGMEAGMEAGTIARTIARTIAGNGYIESSSQRVSFSSVREMISPIRSEAL